MAETLKDKLDSLDDLPEALHPYYAEKDGTFFLQFEGGGELKSALSKERDDRKQAIAKAEQAEARLKELERERDALAKKLEETEKSSPKAKDVEERIETARRETAEQLTEKHKAQMTELQERVETMGSRLEKTVLNERALHAMNEAGVDAPDLLLPHIKNRLKAVEVGDGYEVRVLDEAGREALSSKGMSAEPMTIGELLESYKTHEGFGRAFRASGSRGSSAPPGGATTNGGGQARHRGELRTRADKAKFIEEHGPEAYASLPPAPQQPATPQ